MPLFDSVGYDTSPPPPPTPDDDALSSIVAQINAARAYRGQAPNPSDLDVAAAGNLSDQDQLRTNLLNTAGTAAPYRAPSAFGSAPPVPDMPDPSPMSALDTVLHVLDPRTAYDAAQGMATGAYQAARLPGDVLTGKVDPTSQEGIRRAADLAMTFGMLGAPVPKPAGSFGIAGGRLPEAAVPDLPAATAGDAAVNASAAAPQWGAAARTYLGDQANWIEKNGGDPEFVSTLRDIKAQGPSYPVPTDDADYALRSHLREANTINFAQEGPSTAPGSAQWSDRARSYLSNVKEDHRFDATDPYGDGPDYAALHAGIADAVRDMKAAGPGGYQVPADARRSVQNVYGRAMEINAQPPDLPNEFSGEHQLPSYSGPPPSVPSGSSEDILSRIAQGINSNAGPDNLATSRVAQLYPEDVPPAPIGHPALASHAAQVGMSPQEFADTMFGDGHRLTSVSGDANSMTMAANLPDGSYIKRTFQPDGSVYHALFKVPDAAQGGGTSKAILQSQIPLYQQMGRTRVDVHANIDVGGYAWARYGFVPNQGDWNTLRKSANMELDAVRDQIPPDRFARLKAAARSADPRSMWTLVDDKTPIRKGDAPSAPLASDAPLLPHDMSDEDYNFAVMLDKMRAQTAAGTPGLPVPGWAPPQRGSEPASIATPPVETQPLGKHLFLGSNWRGKLDLGDQVVMERFNKYANGER